MFNQLDYVRYFVPKILRNLFLSCTLVLIIIEITNTNSNMLLLIFFILTVLFFLYSLKRFEKEKLESIKRTKNIDYLDKLRLISSQKYNEFIDLYNLN